MNMPSPKRVGKLHAMSKPDKQVDIPCRYCKELTSFGQDQLETLIKLSALVVEPRGEKPIQRDEVAVCDECREIYLEEFVPRTTFIEIKISEADWEAGQTEEDSNQGEIPF